ncbi:hypothetical protein BHE74_00019524 [Ensete ventricosum]|nr:hypothetical protein BHE74_00019524 [Ensete ventricosum]
MEAALFRVSISPKPTIHLGPVRSVRITPPHLRLFRRPTSADPLRLLRPNAVEIGAATSGEPQQEEQLKNSSVLLEVGGMMCGACAARVRSILSADDRVDSAAVNMLTETAAVRLGPSTDEPERVAEELAERLAQCGFPSKRRRTGLGVQENVRKWREMAERKEKLLAASRNRVAFAWTLVALCCGIAYCLLHSLVTHSCINPKSLAFGYLDKKPIDAGLMKFFDLCPSALSWYLEFASAFSTSSAPFRPMLSLYKSKGLITPRKSRLCGTMALPSPRPYYMLPCICVPSFAIGRSASTALWRSSGSTSFLTDT